MSLDDVLNGMTDEDWAELTRRLTKHYQRQLRAKGYELIPEGELLRRDAHWRETLRGLGCLPVTCLDCNGTGTVNSSDTEPCANCDGDGSAWVNPPYDIPATTNRARRLPPPQQDEYLDLWLFLDRLVPGYPEDDDDVAAIRSIVNRRRDSLPA